MSQIVLSKLAQVRRRDVSVRALTGASALLVLVLGAFLLICLLDFLFELPLSLRGMFLAGLLAAAAHVIWHRILHPIRHQPDDDAVALNIERTLPDLRQRLISTVQLTRTPSGPVALVHHSSSMLSRLVAETEELLSPLDLRDTVHAQPLRRWGAAAAGVVLLFLLFLALGGYDARALLLRAACFPGVEVPRKTRVDLLDASPLVARGEDITLTARARGLIPSSGEIKLTYASGASQHAPVDAQLPTSPSQGEVGRRPGEGGASPSTIPATPPEYSPDLFHVTVHGVPENFTYRIYLGDGHSEEGHVRVSVRPLAQKLEAFALPPAYTAQPRTRRSTGDLSILQGSRLELSATASKPVRQTSTRGFISGDGSDQNRVIFLAGAKPIAMFPLALDAADPTKLHAIEGNQTSIPVPAGATGLALILVDEDGLETRDPSLYPVQIVPDRAPTVRVTAPTRQEEVVMRVAEVKIGFDAADDIALGTLRLRYVVKTPGAGEVGAPGSTVGGAVEGKMVGSDAPAPSAIDESKAKSINLDVPEGSKSLRAYYPWRLTSLATDGLTEGTVIEWWLEATDTNNVSGPGKAVSDHYVTRIGTEAQVRDALMSRLNNSFGALQDTQQSQQDLTRDLGKLITEKPLEEKK